MATEDDPQKKPQPLSALVMYLTTSAILLGNISFGCSSSAHAPALANMAWRYKTTIADISVIFTLTSVTYCVGAIICGCLSKSKHINRQLIVILSLLVMAATMFMTPYCPTKWLFFACSGLFGFASGFYGLCQIVWIIEMWQHKAGPFIQAQHFCYSAGTIIPSVVLAPFLNKGDHSYGDADASQPALTEQSTIYIPFLIIGTVNLLAFMYQLFLFVFYRYQTPPIYANEKVGMVENDPPPAKDGLNEKISSKQHVPNDAKVNTGIISRKIQLFAFGVLFLGAYQAMEISTMQFLPVFGQYSDLKLTESSAANVLTGLMLMYATGRLLGIIIIFKVRPELIIVANLMLIVTGNVILLAWANSSVTMLWIGTMILGTGFSTTFPSFFGFIEKHMIISDVFTSCTMVVGTTTSAMYPIILGKIIEHHAVVLTYTNFASTFVCIVTMVWGYVLTRKAIARE